MRSRTRVAIFVWMGLGACFTLGACGSSTASGGFVRSGGSTGTGTGSVPGGITCTTGQGGEGQGGAAGQGGATASTGGAPGVMSAGCGKTTTQATEAFVKFPLTVAGQPASSLDRLYYVHLPANYDPTRAYKVIYLGPGCGPQQDFLTDRKGFPFETDACTAATRTDAILVQMEPGLYNPATYNPATCRPGNTTGCNMSSAYCFDDWAYLSAIPDAAGGVLAIERAYFDLLHKAIETDYCVDTSRQFFAGYSSGGWMAHQLGCWFPDVLRAQAAVTGGLPPPLKANVMGTNDYCVKKPIAGFFIHNNPDTSNDFSGSVDAARRLFALNGCTGPFNQPPLPNSTAALPEGLVSYSIKGISNSNAFRCFQYANCPVEIPTVFCVSNDSGHTAQNARAVPAFWDFFTKF